MSKRQNMIARITATALFAGSTIPMVGFSAPSYVDLSTWKQQGVIANGDWQVSADKRAVVQTINGRPTFYVSPNNFINGKVKGNIEVYTHSDDDFVGFVFGYKGPVAELGDDPTNGTFVLFDWKQLTQKKGLAGYNLVQVSDHILPSETKKGGNDCFWNHEEGLSGCDILATDYGEDRGWRDNTKYWFELDYRTDRVIIKIGTSPNNLSTIFDVEGNFEPGHFGFYNFSQSHVRYSDLISESSTGTGTPLANHDAYETDEAVVLNVPATKGVLANDTSFTLNGLTVELGDSTKHGSLSLNADGSFSYAPGADFHSSDSFTYRIFDGSQYSDYATVKISNTSPTYTASGTLKDEAGHPIAGAVIQVAGQTIVTDADGYWEITGLKAGKYDIVAEKDGYTFPAKDCEVGNDQNCHEDILAGSQLALDVKAEPRHPKQGEPVTYIMTVYNRGEQTATGIVLDVPVPEGAELVTIRGDQGVNCDGTVCTMGDLAAGQSASVSMVVNNQLSTKLVNTLTLSSNEYPTELVEKTVYASSFLSIKGASRTQVITKGDEFDAAFRVAVNEYAPEAARNIQLKTELARGYQLLGVSGADCDTAGLPQLICNMDDIAAGESRDVNFDLKLNDFYALWASHRAVVKADNYPADHAAVQTKVYLGGGLADVIVAIDVTGSMQDELDALESVTTKLREALNGRSSPMMAVVSFRDDIRLEAASTHLDEVVNAIGKLEASGGGACPEASHEAMMLAVEHAKEGATLILVTDAPPYPGSDMNQLVTAINQKNIEFILVRTETMCSPVSEWEFQK